MVSQAHDSFGEQYSPADARSYNEAALAWEYLEVVAAYASERARWLAYMVNGEEVFGWRQAGPDISTYLYEVAEQSWHLISVRVPAHRIPAAAAEHRIYVFKR